ncbi:imelysin family protein [Vibrio agarivorans]|uniref:Imelysin family protein n=1 Tax=Vibrio agarivorans TaxID=153622 RepID=A0ABT7Y095_9VIBR|nr:imelysin family protein [Vibrio agarivorans]MDN2481458.1 imelysin family protein [Vibrio agarivorans]
MNTNKVVALATIAITPAVFAQDDLTQEVIENYANIAHAVYADALSSAQALQVATDKLITSPSEQTLQQARQAWLVSRQPYQQSEVFRFGNSIVDDWEGQLNAWPLDEGLIDYVASDYQYELGNGGATANIIANRQIQVGNEVLNVSDITPELLASLNELGGSEANVATGYHAIEFLLWGQDLNGTNAGAGERQYSDFVKGSGCTNGNCDRRADYLAASVSLLIDDLVWMEQQWAKDQTDNYRQALTTESQQVGLRKMLFGMGSLSLGELAGERMKVALEANSTEDEHDCFSDNTHNSHYYNALGVYNIYTGTYKALDGSKISGPSLNDLVAKQDAKTAKEIQQQFDLTLTQVGQLVESAEQKGQSFDQLIAADNPQGHDLVNKTILSLVAQTVAIEKAAQVIGVDSLNPDTADHEF